MPSLALVQVAEPQVVPMEDTRRARLERAFEQHSSFIWRSVRRLGLSIDESNDATQQAFLIAARRIDEIEPGKERSFLFQTARRIVLRVRRDYATSREHMGEELDHHADPRPGADDELGAQRSLAVLQQILDAMDDDRRAVFILYEIERITMAEIATILEIPPGTVASRLRSAREQFRVLIARKNLTPAPGRG
jgi:RNA polymerase sigma-70 factor (ECF subfamily)